MSDPRHIEKLSEGVEAWNAWRAEHPDIIPDLSGSHIRVRELSGANLSGVNLRGALLPGAALDRANLDGADLSQADLMEADLQGASLTGANLEQANLMGSHLGGANLEGANLTDAVLFRTDLQDTECAYHCAWFDLLVDFADSLLEAEGADRSIGAGGIEGSFIESSFVSTRMSRIEIALSDSVSTKATYEILGALNRLYTEAASHELLGPIIKLGSGDGLQDEADHEGGGGE
jgi:hypothetical protein